MNVWREGIGRARRVMRARRRELAPRAPARTHRGIELSIRLRSGAELMRADSDVLYWRAFSRALEDPCGPACHHGCDRHGWVRLVDDGAELEIRMRPRLLADMDASLVDEHTIVLAPWSP